MQRLDILAHGKPVDALARLVARSEADSVGRSIIAKMKEMMERQQFDVILQVKLLNFQSIDLLLSILPDIMVAHHPLVPPRLLQMDELLPARLLRPCERMCWPSAMGGM